MFVLGLPTQQGQHGTINNPNHNLTLVDPRVRELIVVRSVLSTYTRASASRALILASNIERSSSNVESARVPIARRKTKSRERGKA